MLSILRLNLIRTVGVQRIGNVTNSLLPGKWTDFGTSFFNRDNIYNRLYSCDNQKQVLFKNYGNNVALTSIQESLDAKRDLSENVAQCNKMQRAIKVLGDKNVEANGKCDRMVVDNLDVKTIVSNVRKHQWWDEKNSNEQTSTLCKRCYPNVKITRYADAPPWKTWVYSVLGWEVRQRRTRGRCSFYVVRKQTSAQNYIEKKSKNSILSSIYKRICKPPQTPKTRVDNDMKKSQKDLENTKKQENELVIANKQNSFAKAKVALEPDSSVNSQVHTETSKRTNNVLSISERYKRGNEKQNLLPKAVAKYKDQTIPDAIRPEKHHFEERKEGNLPVSGPSKLPSEKSPKLDSTSVKPSLDSSNESYQTALPKMESSVFNKETLNTCQKPESQVSDAEIKKSVCRKLKPKVKRTCPAYRNKEITGYPKLNTMLKKDVKSCHKAGRKESEATNTIGCTVGCTAAPAKKHTVDKLNSNKILGNLKEMVIESNANPMKPKRRYTCGSRGTTENKLKNNAVEPKNENEVYFKYRDHCTRKPGEEIPQE